MERESICRLCLDTQTDRAMVAIFGAAGEETAFSLKIGQCSAIELVHGSDMPEHICQVCIEELEKAYQFRQKCESSDTILRSFVQTAVAVKQEALEMSNPHAETSTSCYQLFENAVVDDSLNPIRNELENRIELTDPFPEALMTFEGLEFDDENRGLLKVKVMGENQYVEYRVNMADVDLLDDGTLELVQRADNSSNRSPHPLPALHVDHSDDRIEDDTALSIELTPVDDRQIEEYYILPKDETCEADVIELETIHKGDTIADNQDHRENSTGPNTTVEQCNIRPVKKSHSRATTRIADSNNKPKVCEICGNEYKYQHALESHMRRHRNEKPHKCTICGKGFVIKFELSRHMRTHTGQKPYACSYCDRRFADFGCRVKHERTHTGERPYQCQICSKWFSYSHVLSNHMLTHTGIKRYACDNCGKRFTKSHHLKAHKQTHDRGRALRGSAPSSSSAHDPKATNGDDLSEGTAYAELQASIAGNISIIEMSRQISEEEKYRLDIEDLAEDEKAAVQLQAHFNDTNG